MTLRKLALYAIVGVCVLFSPVLLILGGCGGAMVTFLYGIWVIWKKLRTDRPVGSLERVAVGTTFVVLGLIFASAFITPGNDTFDVISTIVDALLFIVGAIVAVAVWRAWLLDRFSVQDKRRVARLHARLVRP